MRTRIVLTLICLIGAFLMSMSGCQNRHQENIVEVYETDSIEQNYEEYLPTVYDVLQEREEMRYMQMVDSVYLIIPEQILTHMLVTKGTTMSMMEIVEDYLNNKSYYHDTILNTMNIQKQYLPDSIPDKAPMDELKISSDSLRSI